MCFQCFLLFILLLLLLFDYYKFYTNDIDYNSSLLNIIKIYIFMITFIFMFYLFL